jgi:hypothetical protein
LRARLLGPMQAFGGGADIVSGERHAMRVRKKGSTAR